MTLARILRFDRDFKLIGRYTVFSLSLRVHFINIFFSIDDYDLVTCRGVQHIHNEYRRISLCIGKGDQCPGQEYGNKFHHLNSNGPFGVEFRILKKKKETKNKTIKKDKKLDRENGNKLIVSYGNQIIKANLKPSIVR